MLFIHSITLMKPENVVEANSQMRRIFSIAVLQALCFSHPIIALSTHFNLIIQIMLITIQFL